MSILIVDFQMECLIAKFQFMKTDNTTYPHAERLKDLSILLHFFNKRNG